MLTLPRKTLSLSHKATMIVAGAALFTPTIAQADLMLYPTRLVITDNQRSARVEVINRGTEPETYRVNIFNRRMSETGEIVEAAAPQPGEKFADTMLVHSPSQITLQPGESQTVRVSVRRPSGLADGEYRSHLQFDRIADVTGPDDLESLSKPEKGQVSITVPVQIGASIPVIVRHGKTSATVTLSNLQLIAAKDDMQPLLAFTFNREGTQSVYGDIQATYTVESGKSVVVGQASGLAVYVPNATRTTRIPLVLPEGTALKGGSIRLTFSERPDAGGKLLAEATIAVP